jgi:fructose/tagatose bisphosphate aldolase
VDALLTGRQVRAILDRFNPFDEGLELKSSEERITLLAANANPPLELEMRALVAAAAAGKQSPMLIQLSFNALEAIGNNVDKWPHPEVNPGPRQVHPVIRGAGIASKYLNELCTAYGAKFVGLSIDHFKVPSYPAAPPVNAVNSLNERVMTARVLHALEEMYPVFGEAAQIPPETMAGYVTYLCSPVYEEFKRLFVGVVAAGQPAWAMIDTEKLPPALDFVVTRDVTDAVRTLLGNTDVQIEAEYGATGQSGQVLTYEPLRGEALEQFAREVSLFVTYTHANAIAYPIGMEHAAKSAERHEPDVTRLTTVQKTLIREIGSLIPFAQHGGTGAAHLETGLVSKNNVNTQFLVAQANAIADFVEQGLAGIRAGDKKYCGTNLFNGAVEAVTESALAKLNETRSRDKGADLADILTASEAKAVASAYESDAAE